VLFVDDEPDVRKTIKLTLIKAGFTLVEAKMMKQEFKPFNPEIIP